jgi:hypothetical protein
MSSRSLEAKALADFQERYPTITSGDMQTFHLAWEAGFKAGIDYETEILPFPQTIEELAVRVAEIQPSNKTEKIVQDILEEKLKSISGENYKSVKSFLKTWILGETFDQTYDIQIIDFCVKFHIAEFGFFKFV